MFKKIINYVLISTFVFCLLIGLFLAAVYNGVFGPLHTIEQLKDFKNQTASLVLSSDGEILGKYFDQNRTNIDFSDLPSHIVNALVATEDARYFEHEGVDSRSLLRVLFKSILLNKKNAGGGSTINQQLAKNMYGRERHGVLTMLVNKAKEGFLAYRLEKIYTKEEILALYLNTVPFGENIYGIEAASRRFFNRPIDSLRIEQGAVLIGLLKANNYYNPRLYPENALKRRNVVLSQMEKYGYLTPQVKDSLQQRPLQLDYANLAAEGPANYFLIQVKKDIDRILTQYNATHKDHLNLLTDGLVITTTLDYSLQTNANQAFSSHLATMQKKLNAQYRQKEQRKLLNQRVEIAYRQGKFKNNARKNRLLFQWDGFKKDSVSVKDSLRNSIQLLQAGLLALDPNTGAIKAYVGGIDYQTQPYDQIYAQRQMASTFKPILYAAALAGDMTPCTYLENEAKDLKDYANWQPQNYDKTSGGKYTMAAALAKSMNIPTVNLFLQTPFSRIQELWNKLGFSQPLENKPASALGTGTASIYETAIAYSSFANGGYKVKPQSIISIKTATGKIIYQNKQLKQQQQRVLSKEVANQLSMMLQKAIQEGTGTSMVNRYGITIPLAGKTGTSQDYSDAWFAAYTPKIVFVTRVGASDPSIRFTNGANGSGSKLALPLVAKTLQGFQHRYQQPFELSVSDIDCEDYREDTGLNKFLNGIFKGTKSSYDKEQRKAERKERRKVRREQRSSKK
ncbi:transglycosylase domain-containing protein [Flavobacteriaceae bacterium F08102]|nr:transglycosylase domain-containing protein [Flavobacteriaceae bacterium F08102]